MYKNFLLPFVLLSSIVQAQQSKLITEDNPLVSDGIEYGYSVKNVSKREVNNKDFARFEVTLYVTNKGNCNKLIVPKDLKDDVSDDSKTLAKYDCLNATGAKLTSKTGEVHAKPLYVSARVKTKDKEGKDIWENQKLQLGYYLGVGETVDNNVIFIVPLDTKPEIKVRVLNQPSVL